MATNPRIGSSVTISKLILMGGLCIYNGFICSSCSGHANKVLCRVATRFQRRQSNVGILRFYDLVLQPNFQSHDDKKHQVVEVSKVMTPFCMNVRLFSQQEDVKHTKLEIHTHECKQTAIPQHRTRSFKHLQSISSFSIGSSKNVFSLTAHTKETVG